MDRHPFTGRTTCACRLNSNTPRAIAFLMIACCMHGSLVRGDTHQKENRTDSMSVVSYEDFGAKGDGKTDDLPSIVRAHAHANQHGLSVRASDQATYYIGGLDLTAKVQTDTDFGDAKFIIDDRDLDNIRAWMFEVRSALSPIQVEGVTSLKREQEKLELDLPHACVLIVTDSNVKRYIRFGGNQNRGSSQTDVFLVDQNGNVDPNTPIIWDFDQITEIKALPVDEDTLTITGGHFTTIANAAESKYNYHARGINILRSNVVVDGLEHHVTGEGDHGAPYSGFIAVTDCANVTVRDTVLTGRKTYRTIGAAGRTVSMGSYDISLRRALNVSFVNCRQTNDINDRKYWGIMGSNFCKNLRYENCEFSRFDAHQGVVNATIRDSTIGHMGIQLIGSGTFLLENTTVHGGRFITLRPDYGSTWRGGFIIRNCTFVPTGSGALSLIGGSHSGQHDFGYTCHLPEKITIDTLHIADDDRGGNYDGPYIFANFNRQLTDSSYDEKFPYVRSGEVSLKNVTTASGKPLRLSPNPYMFKDVVVSE